MRDENGCEILETNTKEKKKDIWMGGKQRMANCGKERGKKQQEVHCIALDIGFT